MYTITTVKVSSVLLWYATLMSAVFPQVFPVPASEDDSEDLDRLTLTIVVASVVVGVLLVFLFVTFCGCCWLQNRFPPNNNNYTHSVTTAYYYHVLSLITLFRLKQKRKYYEPSETEFSIEIATLL